MADNGNNGPAPSSPALEIVTKEALSSCLLECFASPTFANFVVAAINPYLDKINLQMNKNSEAVTNHTQEIANMKQKLEDQNLKIKSLEKKVTSKEKADKLSILKITGLKNSETDAIHTLLQLAKEKLEVPLQRDDFTIRLIRPGTSKIPLIHAVQLHSLWKRKQIYQARSKLKDTSIYLAENLTRQQQNIFYQCRKLRKSRVITSTWTYDCTIYIRTRDGVQHAVETEEDLKRLNLQREDTPFATPQASPAPSVSVVPGGSSEVSVHGASSLQLFTQSEITATQGFEVSTADSGSEDSTDEPPEQDLPPEQLRRTEPGHHRKNQINHNG